MRANEILGRTDAPAPRRTAARSAPARPVAASRRSLARSSVSRNSGSSGRKNARGCGSKVSAAAGRPSAPARARAPPRSRRGGRDARRRNCRWRRRRPASARSAAASPGRRRTAWITVAHGWSVSHGTGNGWIETVLGRRRIARQLDFQQSRALDSCARPLVAHRARSSFAVTSAAGASPLWDTTPAAAKMSASAAASRIVACAELLGVDAGGDEQAIDAEGDGAFEIGPHRIRRSPARARGRPARRARPRRDRQRLFVDRAVGFAGIGHVAAGGGIEVGDRARAVDQCRRRARPRRRDWRRSSAGGARACAR